jgi:putative colanic acid biosynthesis UDP-glucose lipid carrier transferase
MKRTFDLVVGSLLLIATLPLMLLIAVAIKLTSRGPVLFRQYRIGKNREQFRLLKFRTMEVGNHCTQVEEDDPRVTMIGRLLRKVSLDELPQLLNVVCGEMSLAGPRPYPRFVECAYDLPDERYTVRPGITGLAQVSGYHGKKIGSRKEMRKRTKLDLQYIEGRSLWLDLKIIARTPFVMYQ